MLVYIIIASASIAWLFLLIPSILYLFKILKIKFDNLMAVFDDQDVLTFYFKQFFPSQIPADEQMKRRFKQICSDNYGRGKYFIPLILLGIISALGLLMITINLLNWVNSPDSASAFKPFPPIAISAFLGCYMWVANDQIQRARKRDFSPYDLYVCSFRFLIAIPVGFSFSAISISAGVPLAFFLGMLPTNTLFKYGRRFVDKKLGIGEQSIDEKSELEQLQCINRIEAERFQAEGINNICQLAYCNPVDLTLRTNFDWNYIVDWVSQALLWLYVEKDIAKLRLKGIRGAQEVHVLCKNLKSHDSEKKDLAENCLKASANVMGLNEKQMLYTLISVRDDPYTKFLCNVWS